MAEQKIEKVIDIQVNYREAITAIGKYREEVERTKAEEKELARLRKEGTITNEQYNRELSALKVEQKQYTDAIRVLNKEVQNSIKANKDDGDSLMALRAKLSNLTKEYDNMSRAQREGSAGKALEAQINAVTDELKSYEEATQRYYRNVGNYYNSVRDALHEVSEQVDEFREEFLRAVDEFGAGSDEAEEAKGKWMDAKNEFEDMTVVTAELGKESDNLTKSVIDMASGGNGLVATFLKMATSANGLSTMLKAAGQAALGLGKQLIALMANPIVATFTAIAAVVTGIVNAFKRSEDQTNRLKAAMAAFEPILDLIKNIFTALADAVLLFVEALSKAYHWLMEVGADILEYATNNKILADAIREANKESEKYVQLEKDKQALTKRMREMVVEEAKEEASIAKLKDEATRKDIHNTQERLQLLELARHREEALADKRKAIAEENLRILEEEVKKNENDAAANDALAKAKADVYRVELDLYNLRRKYDTQIASLNEEQKRAEEEDAKNAEEAAKRRAEAAREAARKRASEREKATREEMKALREAEDAMLELVIDTYEKQYTQTRLQYDREIEDLRQRLEKEKNLTEKAREAINQTIVAKEQEKNQVLADLEQNHIEQLTAAANEEVEHTKELQRKRIDALIAASEKWSDEEQTYKKQKMQEEYEAQLAAIDQEVATDEWKSEQKALVLEAYLQKQNELTKQYGDHRAKQEEETAKKEQEIQQAKFEFISGTMNGLRGILDAFGEDNKAMAKLSKVLALGEIAVNTGKALAAGIASAQSVPFPGNIAAIATTVTTILANIASAISTVKSAKFAQGGKVDAYATGGRVSGPGSGTSDSIHAMLSNGESVMTAAATSMFSPVLSAVNQMGGGVPIGQQNNGTQLGEAMLARAFAAGAAMLPAPRVAVDEIATVANRVSVIENMAQI